MNWEVKELVVKLSVSNMAVSQQFYTEVLRFQVDARWTLDKGGNFGEYSYLQLNCIAQGKHLFALGLFKDIEQPFIPLPQTGTVPSLIVTDLDATLAYLQSQHVVVDEINGEIIQTDISDAGFEDRYFFFRDPDNNSLVIRQNMNA